MERFVPGSRSRPGADSYGGRPRFSSLRPSRTRCAQPLRDVRETRGALQKDTLPPATVLPLCREATRRCPRGLKMSLTASVLRGWSPWRKEQVTARPCGSLSGSISCRPILGREVLTHPVYEQGLLLAGTGANLSQRAVPRGNRASGFPAQRMGSRAAEAPEAGSRESRAGTDGPELQPRSATP